PAGTPRHVDRDAGIEYRRGGTLVAFVACDGPATAGAQGSTVSGAGLGWRLVSRADTQYGTAEIWSATAASALTNVTVTATETKTSYDQMLTVMSFEGSSGVGAVQAGGAGTGAPSVTLTTSAPGSLVYGVGDDWDTATARTAGANQT